MKLSEAIRLGAMLKPQIFGTIRTLEGSCALGAAIDGAGLPTITTTEKKIMSTGRGTYIYPVGSQFVTLPAEWLSVIGLEQTCPVDCGAPVQPIKSLIAHFNDTHKWSRERIADWVELQEVPPVPEVAPMVEEPTSV